MKELIRKILKEETGTKSTDKEFDEIKDSWFYTLKNYTLEDIVNNWDSLKNDTNDNIQTIKYFVNNPDKITDLIYDEKGLEDGYHRLIAAKILGIPRFKYIMEEIITEARVKKSDRVQLLKEEIEHGGGIFYHNSDYDIKSFIPQVKKTKKTNFLFFSNEPNTFIDRKFTYKVKLEFNPNKIFNTFRHITKYGIKYTLDEYKGEVLRLFENNTEYFSKEGENTGVDSVGEVMEYYLDEGGNEDDMVGLLYYFITKWNDSWAIIETDLFLNFIESKGYNGFVTQEEGLINIACKDFLSIDIINKQNMW